MQLKNITYQSSSIFYRVTGNGKPVVLLHGFGEDGEIWNKQVEFLKDHFQLIIPDLPGSGKSAVISGQSAAHSALPVGIEEYAEVVRAILSEQKIDNCVMVGHSMGGYISLAFAEKYPSMLSSFALVHSSAFADSEEKKVARLKSIEFIKKNGAYEFLKTSIEGLFKVHIADTDLLIEKGRQFSSGALIQYYQAMIARPDRTAVLKSFKGPILFIVGEHDPAIPFQQSLQQSYLPQRSHIHILRNSAHMGMLEQTAETNAFLWQFLQ